jgi:prepilin peptidase dependent protein B
MLIADPSVSGRCRGSFTNGRAGNRQAGATLMETMIALALSVVVTTAMVVLMGNSMGTSNRITQMTQLTDELRNVMSMMTRDVRRANYSSTSIYCYGNSSCAEQDETRQIGTATAVGDMIVADGCLIFQLDRLTNHDGDATNDSKGGFRRVPRVPNGEPGVIQMWVNADALAPACDDADDADGWMAVTDPNIVDITAFVIDDSLSAEKSIFQNSGTTSYTQRQRYLSLAVEGELILEQRMGWNQADDALMVKRRVEDVISVRNDFLSPPVAVAP